MNTVRLATKQGAHITDVEVPRFLKHPEVMVWGCRTFVFHQELSNDGDPCIAEYREVFAYYIIPDGPKC